MVVGIRLSRFHAAPFPFASMFQVVAKKPYLAKHTKGVQVAHAWEGVSAALSTVPPFSLSGGVTARGCKGKYLEMAKAHRAKRGEFASGVGDAADGDTYDAISTCVQEEDAAIQSAAKGKGVLPANVETKQDRAEVRSIFTTVFSAGLL